MSFLLFTVNVYAEILKKIEVTGNKRISKETIRVYGDIQINQNYKDDDINAVIKKLYDID